MPKRFSVFFWIDGSKQNAEYLLTPVSDTSFILFHMVVSVLLSVLAILIIFRMYEMEFFYSNKNCVKKKKELCVVICFKISDKKLHPNETCVDRCGCVTPRRGWSTSSQRCKKGSSKSLKC